LSENTFSCNELPGRSDGWPNVSPCHSAHAQIHC
jgi:hypothetical protein